MELNKNNLNNLFFTEPLKCTDASIYYEDSVPYIKWTGKTKLSDGSIVKLHIPKMGLDIKEIENNSDYACNAFGNKILEFKEVLAKNILHPVNSEYFTITVEEREMTKEQIEKELGYKIKIKK